MSDISKRMIDFRARKNISQSKLAEMCHVTMQTINNVESGRQKPSRLTEAKIEMAIKEGDAEDEVVNLTD